ncbi:S8 family serine peptidase [Streptomyces sp. NPDC055025]
MRRAPRRTRRPGSSTAAAVVAGAAALTLAATAGTGTAATGPAPARTSGQTASGQTAAGPTASGQAAPGQTWAAPAAAPAGAEAPREVTLITGDRVLVDDHGKTVGLRPAPGRASVPVQMREVKGHSYVLPADAAGLIATDKLDIRLFDVTELSRPEYRTLTGDGVPLLVSYHGSGARKAAGQEARAELRAQDGTTVRAEIDAVDSEALTVRRSAAAEAWASLTARSARGLRLASGVRSVRLDGLLRTTLDVSVPQIGAPSAWAAGHDGKGVKVAVLDTGVDTNHADFAGQIVAGKNFTSADSADIMDRYGHGTHVASIVAGTGAQSKGQYKGVAPGARLLIGKVAGDRGAATESAIMSGMEWAVDEGAKIVNLSIGGPDTPGVDPLEETVNRLSAKALFVIAAGNSGPRDSTVGTPGTADGALTVGAVDKRDTIADFSSRGPRIGDGGAKPDITAPGVAITAAAAKGSVIDQNPGVPHPAPGYVTLDGTSMATPHVAGAAALLAQQHPDWSGARLKAALTGSAKPGPYSAVEQGSGRVDVTHAITQSVVTEPASLSFGAPAWPHTDDQPITRTLTYRNTGTEPLTLDLAATATGPKGAEAPAGFFALGASRVTVPADGTASVDITADPTLGGDTEGVYSLAVTATGGGQSVRTAGAVLREGEMYDLTLKATARDGSAPADGDWTAFIYDLGAQTMVRVSGDNGSAQVRLPRGIYTILGEVPLLSPDLVYIGDDWVAAPRLELTKDTVLAVDARATELIDMAPPDPDASYQSGFLTISPREAPGPIILYMGNLSEGFRTQQVGPKPRPGTVSSYLLSSWAGDGTDYLLADTLKNAFYTGHVQHAKAADLAKVTVNTGGTVTGGRWGQIASAPDFPTSVPVTFTDLASTTTSYLQGGYAWQRTFQQRRGGTAETQYALPSRVYRGGKPYTEDFNTAVFGPALVEGGGLTRDGDRLTGAIRPFADGAGHDGSSLYDPATASTTLYRDGEEYATADGVLDAVSFDLPAERARYRLVTTVGRATTGVSAVTTRVSWSAEFTSGHTAKPTALPASVVRYTPELGLDARAVAGATQSVPVTVQGSAAGRNLTSLTVSVSYDGGTSWSKAAVRDGRVRVVNPAAGGTVSFRADVRDRAGNVFSQTVLDAYLTK